MKNPYKPLAALLLTLLASVAVMEASQTTASAGLGGCSSYSLGNGNQQGAGAVCNYYGTQYTPGMRIVVSCHVSGVPTYYYHRGPTQYLPNHASYTYCPVGQVYAAWWIEAAG